MGLKQANFVFALTIFYFRISCVLSTTIYCSRGVVCSSAFGVYCCGMFNDQCCFYEIYQLWWFWLIWSFLIITICSCTYVFKRRRIVMVRRPVRNPAIVTISSEYFNNSGVNRTPGTAPVVPVAPGGANNSAFNFSRAPSFITVQSIRVSPPSQLAQDPENVEPPSYSSVCENNKHLSAKQL